MRNSESDTFGDLILAEEMYRCHYLRRNYDIVFGPAAELFFHMQYVGHYICKPEFHIKRVLGESVLFLLTVGGEGRLFYKNREYALRPGSVMLIDTSHPHEYAPVSDRWEFKYLHFWGAMSEEYQAYIEENSGAVFTPDEKVFSRADSILEQILDETGEDSVQDYAEISEHIYSLLTAVLSGGIQHGGVKSEAMRQALAYIRWHYRENISTQDIADAVNLSRTYMSELFCQTYGMSPHEYLTMFRVSAAKEMLLQTSYSVSEIAEHTGFCDVFAFSRVFKRKTGDSPTAYRKKCAEK